MEKGEIRFEGAATELLERDDIARAVFLGGHGDRSREPNGGRTRAGTSTTRARAPAPESESESESDSPWARPSDPQPQRARPLASTRRPKPPSTA
jgi:hypothetical protein